LQSFSQKSNASRFGIKIEIERIFRNKPMRPSAPTNLLRQPRGFTMTELLVVIGIIAVLAALLFPTMSRMKAKASSAQCTGNLRQIGTVMGIYMAENNGLLPYSSGYNYTGAGANSWGWDNHAGPLAVLANVGEGSTAREWFDQPGEQHMFNCPAERMSFRTYTANSYLMGFLPGGGKRVPQSAIDRPSNKILIADSHKSPTRAGNGWFGEVTAVGTRHSGKANALFADFHVESVSGGQLTVNDNLKK
jgi:prepilin-type N-terminal cleavage/methylation domain-containing protein/prepilin-type processing-associated H-X9-DG protein